MRTLATKTANHTLHDTNAVAANYGFIADATGSFVGKAVGDSATRTIFTGAGVYSPIRLVLAKLTAASNVAVLLLITERGEAY